MAGSAMNDRFWEQLSLDEMSADQWEALCDGCGRCCLQLLEDEDSGRLMRTRIACHLLDEDTCQCTDYANRTERVSGCLQITPETMGDIYPWMPPTCAYKLLHDGKPLEKWHPLVSGNKQSVFDAGIAVKGWSVSERFVPVSDWESYPVKWVHDAEPV